MDAWDTSRSIENSRLPRVDSLAPACEPQTVPHEGAIAAKSFHKSRASAAAPFWRFLLWPIFIAGCRAGEYRADQQLLAKENYRGTQVLDVPAFPEDH